MGEKRFTDLKIKKINYCDYTGLSVLIFLDVILQAITSVA